MDTQREAWTKVFWGIVTSLVCIAGFACIAAGALFVANESSRVTSVRTDWSGVWIHERDGDDSILRMHADGALEVSNVDEVLVGPRRAQIYNGCWDPETTHTSSGDATVSVMLHGINSFGHTTQLHVRDDDTLYFAEGVARFEYKRYTGDRSMVEIPETQADIESCDGSYWEDW